MFCMLCACIFALQRCLWGAALLAKMEQPYSPEGIKPSWDFIPARKLLEQVGYSATTYHSEDRRAWGHEILVIPYPLPKAEDVLCLFIYLFLYREQIHQYSKNHLLLRYSTFSSFFLQLIQMHKGVSVCVFNGPMASSSSAAGDKCQGLSLTSSACVSQAFPRAWPFFFLIPLGVGEHPWIFSCSSMDIYSVPLGMVETCSYSSELWHIFYQENVMIHIDSGGSPKCWRW